jgi:hypothetical protein
LALASDADEPPAINTHPSSRTVAVDDARAAMGLWGRKRGRCVVQLGGGVIVAGIVRPPTRGRGRRRGGLGVLRAAASAA